MSSQSVPFETARKVGNNLAKAFREVKDENAIENILTEASRSEDPKVVQNAIGKILSQVSPERQATAMKYMESVYDRVVEKEKLNRELSDKERSRQAAKNAGIDADLPESIQRLQYGNKLKQPQRQATENLGIDPDLPPELQKAQYENNLTQQRVNEIFGNQSQGLQEEPEDISGLGAGNPAQNQSLMQKPSALPNQSLTQKPSTSPTGQTGEKAKPGVKDLSEDQLIQLTGIKGFAEPAKAELRRRENEKTLNLKERLDQQKAVSESYKENKDFITKTYDQYEDTNRREAILERSDQLNDSDKLSDSGTILALESLGINPDWLKNPENQEYTKLTLDLLGGGSLQADYGSRILQSEFAVSLKRIPTLSQTKEGRKQITENIRAMLLPAKLKHERMQYYLDEAERTGKPLPHDLRGRILKDIKPQLEQAYDKFKQRNGRYVVKKGTIPNDDALEKYYYLSDGDEKKALRMMKEDNYDTE